MKAIFLDRDGTIIIDKHYLSDPNQIDFFPDTLKALKRLQDAEYLLFIVTNQSGIGRNIFTEKQMHEVHNKLCDLLKNHNIEINEIVFCPHAPIEKCECRKPSPMLINSLIKKWNIDKSSAYMLGDKKSDYEAGQNAGINSALVYKKMEGCLSFDSLLDFADHIL